ncbi:RNA 2',3'-cyclic phosphodiesterase [Pseudophaeobacter sp.]|uniref:RNA 2',3'-cyclic phosphodiesterase n=1 Tax=Pseudophaeobacter sp. TaxID=1971739 RepID=UPI003297A0D1
MRCFLGLSPPDVVLDLLERLQDEIPVGRLVPSENLHITLSFLDDQPEHLLEALHQELVMVQASPLQLELRGLGVMGGKSPKVLCADVTPNEALTQLHRRLRSVIQASGIELPRARFRPHVTLARFGPRLRPEQLQKIEQVLQHFGGFASPAFTVDQITLFQSTLLPDGARYEALAEYPLLDAEPG